MMLICRVVTWDDMAKNHSAWTTIALLATLVYRLASYWLPMPAGAVAYVLAGRKYGRPHAVRK